MSRLKTEILIVGGGVVGGSMALLAALGGVECVLAQRGEPDAAAPAEDPRVLALTLASQKILRFINIWKRLEGPDLGRFERMRVWTENDAGAIGFDSAAVGQPALGHIVRQRALETVLAQSREFVPKLKVLTGASPATLSDGRGEARLTLEDGREVTAKLLIAADGARSRLRQLAGVEYKVRPYGQTAVACVVCAERPHGNVARQRFLERGPLAFLPMAEPRQCAVIWSTTTEQAAALLAMDEAGFRLALRRAFADCLGEIVHSGRRLGFPLQRAQARRYCSDRVALIGDAAHCVHPLAGLGANLGLLDAASLFEVIGAARAKGRDIGSAAVLRKYERWRQGENFLVMMALEGLKNLFEKQAGVWPRFRDFGMRAFDSSPALKRFAIRRAMGLSGDLPAIARDHSV